MNGIQLQVRLHVRFACSNTWNVIELGIRGRFGWLQVRSASGQKAVQEEVEMLQTQNRAAAGHAAPKSEHGQMHAHIGRDLPPTKVLCCHTPLLTARSLTAFPF